MAVLAMSSGIALAEGNWYVGGSIGRASVDGQNVDKDVAALLRDDYGATAVHSSSDDTDTSYKLFAGYKFNKNFAIEGGYADFGRFKASAGGVIGTPVEIKGKIDSYAVFVDAVGSLPLNDSFSLFGKAGAAYTHTKLKVSGSWGGFTDSISESDSEVVPKLGVGAEYNITKSVAVRAEYEHYFNVGDKNNTGESDVGVWSLGVKMSF
ncbi:MAG: porin [Rhodocyclales bacterium]|nr:porin [Rhodocyclales bacterium]